jgi:hypothetical protein
MSTHVSYINTNGDVHERSIGKTDMKNDSLAFNLQSSSSAYTNLAFNSEKPGGPSGKADYVNPHINNPNANPFANMTLEQAVTKLNKSIAVPNTTDTVYKMLNRYSRYYNRFKLPNLNVSLQKAFAHVFFVRPDCYLLQSNSSSNIKLRNGLQQKEFFAYIENSSPQLLKELVSSNGTGHDFMMLLSNYAISFSPSDEYINSDTYGKTYTGYKVAYGKSNIESKTAGNFTITFKDDRNLHIYQLHKLWVEYINGVYRGEITPRSNSIKKKILDYTGALYYIVTAEDGETIIFWSKYYGIFPTQIPSTQYAWGEGNTIQPSQLDVQYMYSFKEDYNPYSILEFNYNSRVSTYGANYIPSYDPELGHAANTWVGAPFIELIKEKDAKSPSYPYTLKLRFRPIPKSEQ